MSVVVVGGGISGLATCYFLQKYGIDYTLIEQEKRLGGKILTEQIGDCVIEAGPDSFLITKPWALELCKELGLSDKLIYANPQKRKVYVLYKKNLRQLPEGIFTGSISPKLLLKNDGLSPWSKLRMLIGQFVPVKVSSADESLLSFLQRRFGYEASAMIEPLLSTIYAGDSRQLSAKATVGSLLAGIRQRGIYRNSSNKSLFMTLRNGMEELVNAIVSRLNRGRIITGRKVISLTEGYKLTLDDGGFVNARVVVLALPAYAAAEILSQINLSVSQILQTIPYASTASVSMVFERRHVRHSLDGYGFVVPQDQQYKITACSWISTKWPQYAPAGKVLIRCFVGRAGDEQAVYYDDIKLVEVILHELRPLLGIKADPVLVCIHRWQHSMPQYLVGHLEKIAKIEKLLSGQPGIVVTGSAYRGVGLADCIHQAQLAAERVVKISTK